MLFFRGQLTRSARRVLGKFVEVGRNVTRAHWFFLSATEREVNVPRCTSLKLQKKKKKTMHIIQYTNT